MDGIPKHGVIGPSGDNVVDSMAECPNCFGQFPIKVIADHTDSCCDVWVGEIEEIETGYDFCQPQVNTVAALEDVNLKGVIESLVQGIPEAKQVNLRVRRKDVWTDVKKVHERGKLSPAHPLKIQFIGEPAVDDGGPLREFFSGKFNMG